MKHKEQITEKLIKKISLRVKELIEKIEKKRWNEATLYTFQVGLSGDIEEAITLTQEKMQKLFVEKINGFKGEEYTDKEIWEEMKQELLTSISGAGK